FRPFAPAVLREDLSDWFELDVDSPYMLLVADVAERRRRAMTLEEQALFGIDKPNVPRSEIPAVTHVDYSARIQTVHAETNPRFHALLSAFKRKTGSPYWSIPASTYGASRSCALRKRHFVPSWGPSSTCSRSSIFICRSASRTLRLGTITRALSSLTDY